MERAVPSLYFVLIALIVTHWIVLASYSGTFTLHTDSAWLLPAPAGLHTRG